jgi:ribonucleoside-diphosphate reductase alpha chain
MKSYITEEFRLLAPNAMKVIAIPVEFGFDGYGEFIFYRTYSRMMENGKNETFHDCVLRVVNGVMSIRKTHYVRNCIEWDETYWQEYATRMAITMVKMHWLPPGRGLWAMGTDYVAKRGAMALYNCAYTSIVSLPDDIEWIMDLLMNGVGVGFAPVRDDELELFEPDPDEERYYVIPDSREGWCESVKLLLQSYADLNQPTMSFDYAKIRPAGLPIAGFGGTASGPEPLKKLHGFIREFCERYIANFPHRPSSAYDSVRLKTDLANAVGVCVIAGNVRRSAEIALGDIHDRTFMDLKDYEKNPDRKGHGYMSNNSALLRDAADFEMLGEIAKRVVEKGEPGVVNLLNFPYGRTRLGKRDEVQFDKADGLNPCGEIPLENKEVCNIAETFPTRCTSEEEWLQACEFAAFYCTTVSMLPTHRAETNRVVMRNRRIGVGIVDFTGWKFDTGIHKITRYMRNGYKKVVSTARELAEEAGIPAPIRHTTIKPGGTVPKLAGKTSGIMYPNFKHMIRRTNVAKSHPVSEILIKAGVRYEQHLHEEQTWVFEFPIICGPAKPVPEISLWEQAINLALVQREWADNAVSNTLDFKPAWNLILDETFDSRNDAKVQRGILCIDDNEFKSELIEIDERWNLKVYEYDPHHEENVVEEVLSFLVPITKSISMLPHTADGVYAQMPESGISEEEYNKRRESMKPIDWSQLSGSDGVDTRYCDGDYCTIVPGEKNA